MASQEKSSVVSGKGLRYWERVLAPLVAWVLLVVIMFDCRTHQRLCEQTHLDFSVSLEGRRLQFGASTMLNGQPFTSGERVPLGHHWLTVLHPKGEPYATNLFIKWYGEHHLGTINLKRSTGTLVVSANPPAGLITIQGPEFSLRLTNSGGITNNVPTDRYAVEASYAHWRQKQETAVDSARMGFFAFAPRLGAAELSCNQSDASFQVFNADNQLLEAGDLPASLVDVPAGEYKLIAWHHKNKHEQKLVVKGETTNTAQIEFLYGAALLETDPPGASIVTPDGQEWGATPRLFSELPVGEWQFQFRLPGYSPVTVVVDVAAGQTNTLSTNLVSINYIPAMNAARHYLSAGDYDRAFAATADALQVKPDDPEAVALQREAVGKQHVRQAEALGQHGDYIGADRELQTALKSLPDDEEAKQLLADFTAREPEQREQLQQERLVRGKNLFDSAVAEVRDADLFESHEVKTSKPLEEVKTAILEALKIRPEFRVTKSSSSAADTFEITAIQELTTALGGRAGRRVCVIVGAQTKDDETEILFEVLEYKAEAVNKVSLGALIGAPAEVKYVPVHPSRIQLTDKLKAQIEEGQKIVIDRIQQAIGGGSEKR